MKIKYIILCMFLALVACQREEDITIATLTYSKETIVSLYYTADISCVLKCNAPFKDVYVHYSTHEDFSDYQVFRMTSGKKDSYSISLSDLEPDVTYFVRYEVSNAVSTVCSEEHSEFRTMALSTPVLSTVIDSTAITYNSAVVGGKITLNGGLNITERGVVYGIGENPTIDNNVVIFEQAQDSFVCELKDLDVVTTYYARAYAKNSLGVSYGESVRFETLSTVATMDSIAVSTIMANAATITAGVLADGGATITKRGVCYSKSEMPSTEDSVVVCEGELGEFTCEISNLYRATVYYVRAFAINANGTAYSEQTQFVTDMTVPVLTTTVAKNITSSDAVIGGTITDDGGASVTECGVVYSTTQNPTTADNKVQSESVSDDFTCELVNLQVVTTYYVRAYAINEKGIAYGEEVTFTTLASMGTLTTSAASNITVTSATVGGNITSDGGAEITARGVCYSTKENPTVDDTKVASGSGVGEFSCNLTGLTFNTTYYVRAYATNSKGTAYGNQITFKTLTTTPTVVTNAVSNITATSATVSGNVTNDGGATITARGICYSTKPTPTISDNKVDKSGTIGTYSCTLEGLSVATTYYARAYATNANGTVYGEEVTFTTLASMGTLTTSAASNITVTSATVGGNITSDGGAEITARGVCYSTTENPTVDDTKVASGSGVGEFSCNLTGLTFNTTYYVRAYATNSKGTAYGNQITFKTLTTTPTVVTSEASNITATSATVGGGVTNDGGSEIIARGICYGTKENPTISDKKVDNSGTTGTYSCALEGLSAATTYYARAYATNANGTVYGEEVTFTTLASMGTLTTSAASNITVTSATVGGNITSDGGAEITARGVCYSTKENPTIEDTKVSGGSGVGEFSCNLTGLTFNTTYYVRAYATNSKGTAYGNQITFKTLTTTPTVVTSEASNITATSATVGGNVTNDGGAYVTERGICYSTSTNPTTTNTKITSGNGLGLFTCNLTDLQDGTTYYFRAYAVNEKGTAYGEEVSLTTLKVGEPIDLGLSVKWATMNVGANNPEDYGDYFAWGETSTKSTYNWSTYKWCNGSSSTLIKYNTRSSDGTVDNKTQLELSDDAVRANWGGSWRMPTDAELTELREQCTWTWTTQNGVNGYKVTSRSNGNSIFLPAAGYRGGGLLYNAGSNGYYWSSSLSTDYPDDACCVYFYSNDVYQYKRSRHYGYTVRPVYP